MSDKKFIVIKREDCICCGACVIASENKCEFIDGKAWSEKTEYDNIDEIIEVCPVEAVVAATEEEYEEAKTNYNL
ncbi:MAG: hypothetical protein ACRC42_05115 [Mycoplasma sp.]